MEKLSLKDIIKHLQRNKGYLYDRFGVTSIGIFGSFVQGEHTSSSDIDMAVEIEGNRKNIHSFLQLKRHLEKETARKIDLGFEHSLKPIVKERIKEQIIYV
ncbi:MAG: nucleotidyltransferase domain-containing protein [Proteobacteria bacterium]|nr:nucleotidyltransferase domain-containing protein [Pseudomonadota bacterium]